MGSNEVVLDSRDVRICKCYVLLFEMKCSILLLLGILGGLPARWHGICIERREGEV
jgi:hypothetical protein